MNAFMSRLKSLFTHPKEERVEMSESITDVVQDQPAVTAADNTDAVLVKLKELLKVAGHDVESVFDDVVALAKKLA